MAQSLPTLDFQDFLGGDPDRRQAFVQEMGAALETIGFFALVNHGFDRAVIAQAYQVAQAFFALPEAVKCRYEDPTFAGQRGFTRFGREHAKDSALPDLKEFWHVGRDRLCPNGSPQEVPEFAEVLRSLYDQLDICAGHLLEACALYLEEAADFFQQAMTEGDTILRVIHYPSIDPTTHPASLRAAPHEDINLITLLCEATAAGLELQQRDGSWIAIATEPGQLIVDSGDMLQWLTNGRFRSTTHRVVNTNPQEPRFSMPFFVHPSAEMDLTPRPRCIQVTGGIPKFPPITAGAYLQQRLAEIGLS